MLVLFYEIFWSMRTMIAIVILSGITGTSFGQVDTIKKKKMTPPDIIGSGDMQYTKPDSLKQNTKKYKQVPDNTPKNKKDTIKSPVKKHPVYISPKKDSV